MDLNLSLCYFACILNLFNYIPNLLASPIIGGTAATSSIYNYHVSIQKGHDHRRPNSGRLLCGGAIIHDRYVLTAAHCFMIKRDGHIERTYQPSATGIVVLAGTSETYGLGIISPVRKIFIPRAYDQGLVKYGDIAILELAVDLEVEDNSDRLQILRLDIERPINFHENIVALVTGNGCDAMYRGNDNVFRAVPNRVAEIRQVLQVHTLPRNRCPYYFDRLIWTQSLDRSRIRLCSKGDSGSPLVYDNKIIGVLSLMPEACQNIEYAMVFTRVSIYINFIWNAVNQHHNLLEMYILDQ